MQLSRSEKPKLILITGGGKSLAQPRLSAHQHLQSPGRFSVNDGDGFIVNNDFVAPVSAVPEPSSLLLLSSAVGSLLIFRRRMPNSRRRCPRIFCE
jgi:hypothetical protein